jgi:predicted DCC family thiol-disulfide oxidoreductase YuxK
MMSFFYSMGLGKLEFIYTLLFFTLSFILVYWATISFYSIRNVTTFFGEFLVKKAFPGTSINERNKFAILRIILGLILLIRSFNIWLLLLPGEENISTYLFISLDILASLMLIFGVFVQAVLLFFLFLMWHVGEYFLGSSTLGNDIAAILAVLLFLTESGRYISLDAFLVKKWRRSRQFLLYASSEVNIPTIALAKFIALFSYWLVCLYSFSNHLNESAWMTGNVAPLLLTNHFMAPFAPWFESLFVSSQWAVAISKFGILGMIIWYVSIVPFVLFGGLFRKFIITWGFLFFVVSLFLLNLGSLAEIEFVLLAAWFWTNIGIKSNTKILLFFDDKCNICDRTVQIITYLDIFNRIKLMPVSKNIDQLIKFKINHEDALTDLYGVDEDSKKVTSGYSLYFWLTKKLVLLWPFLLILWLGKVLYIGPLIYRIIADNRLKINGVCTLPLNKFTHKIDISDSKSSSFLSSVTISHVFILGLLYIMSIPMPYLGYDGIYFKGISRSAKIYGIAEINVFNKDDLEMAENWFTLDNSDLNERIPIFTDKGERLAYHNSDTIYFGHTLRFRRIEIWKEGCAFERWDPTINYLSKIWLHKNNLQAGTYNFIYKQYFQPLPNFELLLDNKYALNKIEKICEKKYVIKKN